MHKRNFTRFFLLAVTAVLFAGCTIEPEQVAPTITSMPGRNPTITAPTPVNPVTATAAPTPTPTHTPQPSPTPCQQYGTVEEQALESDALGSELEVTVYLPPCYDAGRETGYPVLYLLHGQSMDAGVWEEIGTYGAADDLIASGEIPDFIIVAPTERNYLDNIMTSSFGEALLADLLPWIETRYNACQGPSCTAIGGISRGATWAYLLGIPHIDVFGAIGGHSLPNPPFSPTRMKLALGDDATAYPRMYLDIGENDPYRAGAEAFEGYIDGYHISHDWHLNPGTHNEEYWASHVEEYLRWYGEGWE
jgi:hypothetical protein